MSTRRTRRSAAALSLACLVPVGAACSSTASTGAPSTTAAPGTTAPPATTVTVDLKEWSFTPSATSAPAGTITFSARNSGQEVHELVLFKTDLDPSKLPLDEEGAVDERAAGVELVEEVEDVKPGESKSFKVDGVAPGSYVLVCNLVDKGEKHYGHQMYATFTVT